MKHRRLRRILLLAAAAALLSCCIWVAVSKAGSPRAPTLEGQGFQNPVIPALAPDPWVTQHEGMYYYCFAGMDNTILVSRSASLHEISREGAQVVWQGPQDEESAMFREGYWAPELHFIEGHWYIYVAACDGPNENHRMFCLEAESDDPMGRFRMKGKVSDTTDRWAIDGTVLQWQGQLYFIWSGWEGTENVAQNLYIAPMDTPWRISGERVMISRPQYPWEKHGEPDVNEGPQVLIHEGSLYLVYSASGSWTDDYCLGLLRFKGGDPLEAAAWRKSAFPVFRKAKAAYGPGHACFVRSPDGSEDWIIYHATEEKGAGWDGRSTRMQPFTWRRGMPVFGRPAAPGQVLAVPSGDALLK